MICFSIKLETEWFDIFFSRMLFVRVLKKNYFVKNIMLTEYVGLVNLVGSLDHIYDKMPELLVQYQ